MCKNIILSMNKLEGEILYDVFSLICLIFLDCLSVRPAESVLNGLILLFRAYYLSVLHGFLPVNRKILHKMEVPMSDLLNNLGMGAWRQTGHSDPFSNKPDLEDHIPLHQSYNMMEEDQNPNEALITANRQWVFNFPVVGRVQIVKDLQGLVCSSIIVLYWIYGNWSTWLTILLPRYYDEHVSLALLVSKFSSDFVLVRFFVLC